MPEVELKQEKAKLVKTLQRWDLIFFSVCAIIGLDAVAGLAKWGLGQGIGGSSSSSLSSCSLSAS